MGNNFTANPIKFCTSESIIDNFVDLYLEGVESGKFDINQMHNGRTMLSKVIEYAEDEKLCKQMLEMKADPNVHDSYSKSPLVRAIDIKKLDIIKLLIAYGANLKIIDGYDKTVLHDYINASSLEIIEYLVPNMDVNAIDNDGDTCAHVLRRKYEWLDKFDCLVKNGLNVFMKNDDGKTVWDLFAHKSKEEIKKKFTIKQGRVTHEGLTYDGELCIGYPIGYCKVFENKKLVKEGVFEGTTLLKGFTYEYNPDHTVKKYDENGLRIVDNMDTSNYSNMNLDKLNVLVEMVDTLQRRVEELEKELSVKKRKIKK